MNQHQRLRRNAAATVRANITGSSLFTSLTRFFHKTGAFFEAPAPAPLSTTADRYQQHSQGETLVSGSTESTHQHASRWMTMGALCILAALSALDLTVVTTALPAIISSFQSTEGYVWLGGAFILAQTAITPIWGTVADIWGRKPITLIALAVFLTGSLLCALAPDIQTLIVGRAVQGLGSAGTSTLVNVIVSDMFSLRSRGLYLAMLSLVWAVASAAGPILGGLFTMKLSWRWCFWINLPFGVAVFTALCFFLRVPSPKTPLATGLKAIDWAGGFLIVGGTVMLLLGLDFGNVVQPWSSSTVICLIVFGAFTIGIFVVNEWKLAARPVIPLRLFASPSSTASFCMFSCNSYVFIGLAYYLPLYSQAVLGVDALTSGLYLLPITLATALAAASAGVFMQQTGRYLPMMYIGQILLAVGVGLFLDLHAKPGVPKFLCFQLIVGLGMGLNLEAPILAVQAATTVRETAAVTATMNFLRSIASALSVVLGGVIFQNEMNAANAGLVRQLGKRIGSQFDGDHALANVAFINAIPDEARETVRDAYSTAMASVWLMYAIAAGLATFLGLFVRAHRLRPETEDPVLGVHQGDSVSTSTNRRATHGASFELRGRNRRTDVTN